MKNQEKIAALRKSASLILLVTNEDYLTGNGPPYFYVLHRIINSKTIRLYY